MSVHEPILNFALNALGDRVRAMTGSQSNLDDFMLPKGDRGLFGPDSIIWRVHANFTAMMVGGLGGHRVDQVFLDLAGPEIRLGDAAGDAAAMARTVIRHHVGFTDDPSGLDRHQLGVTRAQAHPEQRAAQTRRPTIAELTSRMAWVILMPRGQASVQLKIVRQRHTPSASARISSRSSRASSRKRSSVAPAAPNALPLNPLDLRQRLAAILAADLVGYGRLMEANEEDTLRTFRRHRQELLDPTVARHGGRLFKAASSAVGPMGGSGSNFQSPVCNTVPPGVRMISAFDSGMECAIGTNCTLKGPASTTWGRGSTTVKASRGWPNSSNFSCPRVAVSCTGRLVSARAWPRAGPAPSGTVRP